MILKNKPQNENKLKSNIKIPTKSLKQVYPSIKVSHKNTKEACTRELQWRKKNEHKLFIQFNGVLPNTWLPLHRRTSNKELIIKA